jgi:phage-related protein
LAQEYGRFVSGMSPGRFGFYTKFTATVYVLLRCFQKKTAKINNTDIDLA